MNASTIVGTVTQLVAESAPKEIPANPASRINMRYHDLQAQLVNTRSLSHEIEIIMAEITKLLETEQPGLPTEFVSRLSELIEAELGPCIAFHKQSSSMVSDLLANYIDDRMGNPIGQE